MADAPFSLVDSAGLDPPKSSPAASTARMKADIAKWGAVIEKAAIPKRE
jgi:hypothetical protein